MFKVENIILFIVLIIALICIIGLPYAIISEKNWIQHQVEMCEGRGGTLLKNTYKVGKSTSSSWVCVKPDVIIEL